MTDAPRWVMALLLGLLSGPLLAQQRVVALGGDITETVYALGAGDALVGVDSTSRWPLQATRLPDVGYVRQLAGEGVLALHPQLILATHDAGPATTLAQWRAAGVKVEQLPQEQSPDGVQAKIRQVGVALGRQAAAERLARQVQEQFAALARQVAAAPHRPKVLLLMPVGAGSPMAAGRDTAADRVIALLGADNVARVYQGYKPVSAEALAGLAPDVVLVMRERSEGGGVAAVLALPGMAQTPAGRNGQVLAIDGQAILGFGPRTAERLLSLQRELVAR